MVEIGLTDAKTTLKRPSGAPKTSQRQPQNAPKAIFGSKKRANEAQESSKTNLEALFGRSRSPKELPRAPREPPKSSQKEAERAPKRFQNHHWIENDDFSKSSSRIHKINIFEGRKVSLGAQNRPQEAPRRDKKRHRKKKKEQRRKKEHQERQKELQKALPPFGPATSVCR